MISREVQIRVNYYDTDCMGVVHHSNYARYFETARTEMLRSLGLSYKELEESGVMLPVVDVYTKSIAPAFYDDLLTVRVTMNQMPQVRLRFDYQVFRDEGGRSGGVVEETGVLEAGVSPTMAVGVVLTEAGSVALTALAGASELCASKLIATGYVTLAFVDAVNRRPCRAPQSFIELVGRFF